MHAVDSIENIQNCFIIADALRLLSVRPFKPFSVVTSAGQAYRVESPDHAHADPRRTRFVIHLDDGTSVILPALHLAGIEHSLTENPAI